MTLACTPDQLQKVLEHGAAEFVRRWTLFMEDDDSANPRLVPTVERVLEVWYHDALVNLPKPCLGSGIMYQMKTPYTEAEAEFYRSLRW